MEIKLLDKTKYSGHMLDFSYVSEYYYVLCNFCIFTIFFYKKIATLLKFVPKLKSNFTTLNILITITSYIISNYNKIISKLTSDNVKFICFNKLNMLEFLC